MSEIHPLDFPALKKGDYISQAQLERIFGFSLKSAADAKRYAFEKMALTSHIRRERPDLLPISRGEGILIAEDNLAVEKLSGRLTKAKGLIYRTHADLHRTVDPGNLNEEEKKRLEHTQLRSTNQIVALRAAERAAKRRELYAPSKLKALQPKKENL